MIIFQHNI